MVVGKTEKVIGIEHFIDLSFVCLFEEPRTPELFKIRNILIINASGRKFITAEKKKNPVTSVKERS